MNPFPQILHTRLDAEMVGATYDDFLFSVYILHTADTWAAAREAPEMLTLDVLHRVAWFLGLISTLRSSPEKRHLRRDTENLLFFFWRALTPRQRHYNSSSWGGDEAAPSNGDSNDPH